MRKGMQNVFLENFKYFYKSKFFSLNLIFIEFVIQVFLFLELCNMYYIYLRDLNLSKKIYKREMNIFFKYLGILVISSLVLFIIIICSFKFV